MISNKNVSFSCTSPLSTSSNNIYGKETFINIDNLKKSTTSSTKHCNSKIFCILQIFLQNVLSFSLQIYLNFLYCPKLFIFTKILILPVLLLK